MLPTNTNPYTDGLLANFPTPPLSTLSVLLSKLKSKGYYYHRKSINLDGLTFEECSFENCIFFTNTGNFNLINCRIYGAETTFTYTGHALKVAKLHEFMNAAIVGRIVFPSIYPTVDKDGRVTI